MSNATTFEASHGGDGDAHHDPHLAHHFETPEQQFQSGKLGMWMFLATEILMFGGLFCAYSVYRHNHPEVFAEAHKALDRKLGAINTIVLITSSLTMAWGVRAAQLKQQKLLVTLLGLTLLGGLGFMCIKAIEYHTKWQHGLWIGSRNEFFQFDLEKYKREHAAHEAEHGGAAHAESPHGEAPPGGPAAMTAAAPATEPAIAGAPPSSPGMLQAHGGGADSGSTSPPAPSPSLARSLTGETANPHVDPHATTLPFEKSGVQLSLSGTVADPNAHSADEAKIKPQSGGPIGLNVDYLSQHPQVHAHAAAEHEIDPEKLEKRDQTRLATFFSIYFLMTGLHGIHVLVGMGLIYWIMMRAATQKQAAILLPGAPGLLGFYVIYLGVLTHSTMTIVIGAVICAGAAAWLFARVSKLKALADTGDEFGPEYFTPVDLVGLYWHLVDLIWIFLFPLLYLIH